MEIDQTVFHPVSVHVGHTSECMYSYIVSVTEIVFPLVFFFCFVSRKIPNLVML